MSADNHGKGKIRPGMIFTIEPMVNAGNPNDTQWPDHWTVVTTDGKRSAQFEHTLLVTENGMEILTASPKFYDTSKPVMEMLPFDRAMFQRNWVVCYKQWSHDTVSGTDGRLCRLPEREGRRFPFPRFALSGGSGECCFLRIRVDGRGDRVVSCTCGVGAAFPGFRWRGCACWCVLGVWKWVEWKWVECA